MNLDSFYGKYNTQSVLFDTAHPDYRGECVQLAAFYVQEVWGKPAIWADAYSWYARGTYPEHYIRVPNDMSNPNQVPPRGALVVFHSSLPGSGGMGHIDICWDARPGASTWIGFDSNWGGKYAHLVTHNWSYVVGWILPRSLPTYTAPAQEGEEMIQTAEDAQLSYKILRPNSGASEGEIAATVGRRSFHNFIHDALPEIQARDANLVRQAEEFAKMQQTINQLNQTITDMRTTQTSDAATRAEEQHAANEKISYLTGQLETSHDKITQLQAVDIPATIVPQPPKLSWSAKLLLAISKLNRK